MHRNYCFRRKQHSFAACDAALEYKKMIEYNSVCSTKFHTNDQLCIIFSPQASEIFSCTTSKLLAVLVALPISTSYEKKSRSCGYSHNTWSEES